MLLYSSITFDQEHVDLSIQIHVPHTLLYYLWKFHFNRQLIHVLIRPTSSRQIFEDFLSDMLQGSYFTLVHNLLLWN